MPGYALAASLLAGASAGAGHQAGRAVALAGFARCHPNAPKYTALETPASQGRLAVAARAARPRRARPRLPSGSTRGSVAGAARERTKLVEPDGIEPTTSCLQSRRSPS